MLEVDRSWNQTNLSGHSSPRLIKTSRGHKEFDHQKSLIIIRDTNLEKRSPHLFIVHVTELL